MTPLLHALLAPSTAATERWLTHHPLSPADAHWLIAQGLAPYLYFRLRQGKLLSLLPPETNTLLQQAYYAGALREAVQHREAISSVLAALNAAGAETVLMKGTALAHTVYPNPRCRLKGDLDLWLQVEQVQEGIAALEQIGYVQRHKESRPSSFRQRYSGEQQMMSDSPGSGLIELQWPAIRNEWVRLTTTVDHAGIWQRKHALTIEGQPTHIMAAEDLLLHLCIHLAINHHFGQPWLRALLDIHLLVQESAPSWEAIIERARRWHVATVTWTVLSLAHTLLGTPIPATVLTALAPSLARQRAIRTLHLEQALLEMRPGSYSHRRFLIQTLLVEHPSDILRLYTHTLFPDSEWLQARYNTTTRAGLWKARLLHPFHVLLTAKV